MADVSTMADEPQKRGIPESALFVGIRCFITGGPLKVVYIQSVLFLVWHESLTDVPQK